MSFLLEVIKINTLYIKNIFKHLFSQKTSLHAGNLTYLTILSLIPTLIISISLFNIVTTYIPLLQHPYIEKISSILDFLNLNQVSSIIINLVCINLLSSGIFALLTTFENLYKFSFDNYIKKKLYSIALSIIIILTIVISLSLSFAIETQVFLHNIEFIIDFLVIFLSLTFFYKLATFQKLKDIYIGSVISAFLLTIFIHLFYHIITNFSRLSSYYGILTPLMITFLLIYYSCYIIYLGIIINYETLRFSRIKTKKQ